jgi:endonuclease/exonuclease/phosphatase family metal-dependent hydrolase
MKPILLKSLLLIGILIAGTLPAASAGDGLKIATYNVENYTLTDRLVDGVYRKQYPKPETEKAALRAVIHQLDADVLALQEIGGAPFLTELQRDLRSEGLDYPYAVALNAADTERTVAILSKRELTHVSLHDDLSFKYFDVPKLVKRGLLEVQLRAAGSDVTLFVVHLKSRFTDRPDDPSSALQRGGEAVAIRERILQEFPQPSAASFMILGDFNDSRSSRPLRALLDKGKTPISTWLPATDSRGEVWSHFYRREDTYSRVDHILVSAKLLPHVRDGTARIHDSPEVELASDHRPVVVVIE